MKAWKLFVLLISSPTTLSGFFARSTGAEYGIGLFRKFWLIWKVLQNHFRIPTASHVFEHLTMFTRIMLIPKSTEGCIVECGSWKGGSAANLSLVAELCRRELHIFDSFAGLPDPSPFEEQSYKRGDYCGTLDEVRNNIERCGKLNACTFHPGLFQATLPGFSSPCVFAFIDVDLVQSLKSCLRNLWPLMQPDSYLFSHEAKDNNIVRVFFDDRWWLEELAIGAPGLVGAGTGLGLMPLANGFGSCLGYTLKPSIRAGSALTESNVFYSYWSALR
jgi:O-methyltransferase